MPRAKQSASRRPKGESTTHRCEDCGSLMVMKWSFRREQWFYGCSTYPTCFNTFNAHPKSGAPQPGKNPPDLRPRPKKPPQPHYATYWDVLLDEHYLEHNNMKFVIGVAIEGSFHYWNGEDLWTQHPERIKFYETKHEAEAALNTSGGDFIDDVPDVRAFQDRIFGIF